MKSMTDIDDETLTAFVDGELNEEQNARVAEAISQDPALAARADRFIQIRLLSQQAFSDVLDKPVPEQMLHSLESDSDDNKVTRLKPRPYVRQPQAKLPIALAASITLAMGLLVGYQMSVPDTNEQTLALADAGLVTSGNPLFYALENTPSLQHYRPEGEDDIFTPVMSFKANDGRYCREFEINSGSRSAIGVACRENQAWSIEAMLAADPRPAGNTTDYQPASGYSEAALNAVLDKLWSGTAYDAAEEHRLINAQWPR